MKYFCNFNRNDKIRIAKFGPVFKILKLEMYMYLNFIIKSSNDLGVSVLRVKFVV